MKHLLVIAFLLVSVCFCSCENNQLSMQSNSPIIPRPVFNEASAGYFDINENTKILYDSIAKDLALDLSNRLQKKIQHSITTIQEQPHNKYSQQKNVIALQLDTSITGFDAYHLDVKPNGVLCKAASLSGLRYAVTSFLQLSSPLGTTVGGLSDKWIVPAIHIKDKAQQAKRSLLSESAILKDQKNYERYIDMLSFYKINTLRVEFPTDLWLSDDLVSGQTDSIRGLLQKRHHYAASKGIVLEADVNFVDLMGTELIEKMNANVSLADSIPVSYTMENFPAVLAMDFALPILDRIEDFFPFKHIHLGDPALNNMGYFCGPCETDSLVDTKGLLDSISIDMNKRGYLVDYSGYRMSYKDQLGIPIALGEGISYVFTVDLNNKDHSLKEVYQKADQDKLVYCLESKLEDYPKVNASLLAYADRLWGQYGDYNDFVERVIFHTNLNNTKKPSDVHYFWKNPLDTMHNKHIKAAEIAPLD